MSDRVMGGAPLASSASSQLVHALDSAPSTPSASAAARAGNPLACAAELARLRSPRVDVTRAPRRALHIPNLDSLTRLVHSLREAVAPGGVGLNVSGNWSVGQILHHLSRTISGSLDGFACVPIRPTEPPGPLRDAPILGRLLRRIDRQDLHAERLLLRRVLLDQPLLPAGPSVALPGQLDPFAQVWTSDASAWLLAVLGRLASGERMRRESPTLGPMTHEQWVAFHLRHAELHLSFVHVGADAGPLPISGNH